MLLYIGLTLSLFVVLIISTADYNNGLELQKRESTNRISVYEFIFFSCLFVLWLLTAFRASDIGNDTTVYLDYYKSIADYGVNSTFAIELGYQYFCLILSRISINPYFLLIVCATVCYLICGWHIYKHSGNILFSLVLLFCIFFSPFTNILRQAISMVIVLIAYEMMKSRRMVLSIALILLAASFHTSALICFLWFFHKIIPKKPSVVVAIALCIAILSVSGVLNNLLATIIVEYKNYFASQWAGTGWLAVTYYALRAFVFYIFTYAANKEFIAEREGSLAVSNTVLSMLITCLGFSVNLFARASDYFVMISVVDLSNAFNSGKIKNRSFWMLAMGGVLLAYFIVSLVFRPEWNNLYPYRFSWN